MGNVYKAPESKVVDDKSVNASDGISNKSELEGLGGWLILIAIGICISPIRLIVHLSTYPDLFTSGTWGLLTTQGSDLYNSLWGPILVFEIVFNTVLVFAWLYVGYKFFTKSQKFPKLYIYLVVFSLIFILADSFAITLVLPNTVSAVMDGETIKEITRSVISVVIWVPYMLVSKRVKATFIN